MNDLLTDIAVFHLLSCYHFSRVVATQAVKIGLAEMLKGGVIMDVMNPEQARIAEEAGAVA